jgi:hypothetical protein
MTINKSQKQTFEKIGILSRQPVFTHGQLYVAASRIRSFNGLRFYISEYNGQGHFYKKHRLHRSFESLNSFSNYFKFNGQHLFFNRPVFLFQ